MCPVPGRGTIEFMKYDYFENIDNDLAKAYRIPRGADDGVEYWSPADRKWCASITPGLRRPVLLKPPFFPIREDQLTEVQRISEQNNESESGADAV